MLAEARDAPQAIAVQLAGDVDAYQRFGELLRGPSCTALLTLARGSSDHAAQFIAYLIMARLGRLVTSLPMSLITLYQSKIGCEGLVAMAFSQSGQSPDLVEPARLFSENGATTAAFVNDTESPLARSVQWVFPLHAGVESSVAATKSFIAQLVAGVRVVAAWQQDADLHRALTALPEVLAHALAIDWSEGVGALLDTDRLIVIGRGTSMPVALEAALKLKETCAIQAEAFSAAEVRHGPMALIENGYPLLVFAPRGPAQGNLLALAQEMRERGAKVLLAAPADVPGCDLPIVEAGLAELDPISAIASFYPMVEALARARGRDPDQPRHLAKVTRTQ